MAIGKKYVRKTKRTYKKKTPMAKDNTKNLVRLIKSVSLKQLETKQALSTITPSALLHNVSSRLYANLLGTNQGITDGLSTSNRIGDTITPVGIKMYLQMRAPADRPNVTFKIWILKIFGNANPPTFVPVKAITGNNMLDPIDTEKASVVKVLTYKSEAGWYNGTVGNSKENCYFRKVWIPLKRSPYVYSQDNSALGKTYQLAMYATAYDTIGSLITDIIASIDVSNILYFKDG